MHIKNVVKKTIIKTKRRQFIKAQHDECVIFGSGPSLDKLNPDSPFLQGKDLIGCNFIHKHKSLINKKFKLFSMIDRDYTEQVNDAYFKDLQCEHFLISTKNAQLFKIKHLMQKNINIIRTKPFDISKGMDKAPIIGGVELITGNSLPFLIQCAAFLGGYKTIYIFGVDHYNQDDLGDNNNCDNYHGRAIKDLAISSEKLNYINRLYDFVADLCKQRNVTVLNVTPNSKLEAFEKTNIPDLQKNEA